MAKAKVINRAETPPTGEQPQAIEPKPAEQEAKQITPKKPKGTKGEAGKKKGAGGKKKAASAAAGAKPKRRPWVGFGLEIKNAKELKKNKNTLTERAMAKGYSRSEANALYRRVASIFTRQGRRFRNYAPRSAKRKADTSPATVAAQAEATPKKAKAKGEKAAAKGQNQGKAKRSRKKKESAAPAQAQAQA